MKDSRSIRKERCLYEIVPACLFSFKLCTTFNALFIVVNSIVTKSPFASSVQSPKRVVATLTYKSYFLLLSDALNKLYLKYNSFNVPGKNM